MVWSNSPLRHSEAGRCPKTVNQDPFLADMSEQGISMLQDAFSSPPDSGTVLPHDARDTPSCMSFADVRNKIHQEFPKFTIMLGCYVPMCASVSAASTEESSSLTDKKHDVIYDSGGLLHLHCPICYVSLQVQFVSIRDEYCPCQQQLCGHGKI